MGDQAGSLCCLKAELSGLRARGPALAFALPMTESSGWGRVMRPGKSDNKKTSKEQESSLSSLPVFFNAVLSAFLYLAPLPAKSLFPAGLGLGWGRPLRQAAGSYSLTRILCSTSSFVFFLLFFAHSFPSDSVIHTYTLMYYSPSSKY